MMALVRLNLTNEAVEIVERAARYMLENDLLYDNGAAERVLMRARTNAAYTAADAQDLMTLIGIYAYVNDDYAAGDLYEQIDAAVA